MKAPLKQSIAARPPCLQEIAWPSPEALALWVMAGPHRAWLDSADLCHPRSRYSIVTAEPLARVEWGASGQGQLLLSHSQKILAKPEAFLQDWLQRKDPGLIPEGGFFGGVVGFLNYPAGPRERPDADFLLVDSGLLLDHRTQVARLFSWGFQEDLESQDPDLASQRMKVMAEFLSKNKKYSGPAPAIHEIRSWENREKYLAKVFQIKEAIRNGVCYQVNFSQKWSFTGQWDMAELYLRLRRTNPAPQMAFFNTGQGQILSASPEILFQQQGRRIQSFPIKGTRPRWDDREKDLQVQQELLRSEKDAAELLMIVDLVRNDLGKVCEYGTIRVPEIKGLETFAKVHHLVATVEGKLREGCTPWDALHALFPGGSITGAPKLKARELIDQLEIFPRGIYTGSIGYCGFNQASCFNIAIRTAWHQGSTLEFFAGGGIVADSEPGLEFQETLHKAEGFLQALGTSISQLEGSCLR